jgi:hypothetical protein
VCVSKYGGHRNGGRCVSGVGAGVAKGLARCTFMLLPTSLMQCKLRCSKVGHKML